MTPSVEGVWIFCGITHWCVNIFFWMLGDPTFFRQITSFSDSFHYTQIILKNKMNLYVGSLNYFSLYTIQIGSNWYMDTGVRGLNVAFLTLIIPDLMEYVAKIYMYQIGLKCCAKHT